MRLLDDAPLRQTLIAGGTASLAERFNEQTQVARIEAVFAQAIALHRSRV